MIEFFKRLYLNKTVFIVWMSGLGFLFPLSVLMCAMSGQMTVLFGLIYAVTFMLFISLIAAYRRHDLILMNGLITAVMITEILRYAYVVGAYLQMDTETIVELGFMYCLELTLRTFALLVEILIAYNHYTLNTKHVNNQTKIIVNQFALVFLGFVFFGIIVVNWFANTDPWVLLSVSLIYLCDILLYGAVSCCEATLSVDRIDNTMNRGTSNDIKGALWYLVMFLSGLFGLIAAYLIKELPGILVLGDLLVTILSGAGLFYYLHRKKRAANPLFRFGLTALFPVSLSTAAFLTLFFLVMFSQFHTVLQPDAAGSIAQLNMKEVRSAENSYIYQTDDLYLIFPQYQRIEYVFDERPSPSDTDITFYCGASPIIGYQLELKHDKIIGNHAKDGVVYKGALFPEKGFGAFTYFNSRGHIFTDDYPEKDIEAAASKGGDGFMQYAIVSDHQAIPVENNEFRNMRALTEINGRFCIVDSVVPVYLKDFIPKVQALGVKDALTLDMGTGWNHSWVRNNEGETVNLFGIPSPFSHNWIVFRK